MINHTGVVNIKWKSPYLVTKFYGRNRSVLEAFVNLKRPKLNIDIRMEVAPSDTIYRL